MAQIFEKNLWIKLLILLPILYLLFCLLLYSAQRKLIYLPSAALHPLPEGFEAYKRTNGRYHAL